MLDHPNPGPEPNPNQVPGGGLGVFTEEALPRGTTLGAYPGRLLYMAEYSRKLAEHPRATTSKAQGLCGRPAQTKRLIGRGWPWPRTA